MLKAGFILLTIVLAVLLYIYAGKIARKTFTRANEEKQFKRRTALILLIWLSYIALLSFKGVFIVSSLPPRIPLLLILPTFLFFAYLFTNRTFKKIIDNTPTSWPVYFQSFRIVVELLILGLYLHSIVPKTATFEGRNFDIAIGLTAPMMGYYISGNNTQGKIPLYIWNIVGLLTLAIVVFILLNNAYFNGVTNENESILSKGLGQLPFIFLAGFFMPLAVFMHLFSIIKTRKN